MTPVGVTVGAVVGKTVAVGASVGATDVAVGALVGGTGAHAVPARTSARKIIVAINIRGFTLLSWIECTVQPCYKQEMKIPLPFDKGITMCSS
jgi:hypothetical protein